MWTKTTLFSFEAQKHRQIIHILPPPPDIINPDFQTVRTEGAPKESQGNTEQRAAGRTHRFAPTNHGQVLAGTRTPQNDTVGADLRVCPASTRPPIYLPPPSPLPQTTQPACEIHFFQTKQAREESHNGQSSQSSDRSRHVWPKKADKTRPKSCFSGKTTLPAVPSLPTLKHIILKLNN